MFHQTKVSSLADDDRRCLWHLLLVARICFGRSSLLFAQALSQVDGYLRRMPHPEGVREAVSDTAGAAQMIADNGWRCGRWGQALKLVETCFWACLLMHALRRLARPCSGFHSW